MKNEFSSKNNKDILVKRNIISGIATGICLMVLSIFNIELIKHELDYEKKIYAYIAKNQAEHIVTTVDCVMARTTTLRTLIQDHKGDTSFFDSVAENVYNDVLNETGVSLKNVALAPDGIVSNVYPLEGNEALIGFDFLDMSRVGNAEAKKAYEQGTTVLTNPFELIQGGLGMGGRAPVKMNTDEEDLWGLVTVTIDFDNLIENLGFDKLKDMGVNYALAYIDEDGNSNIIHSYGTLDDYTEKIRFKVRNLTWELEVSPKEGWISGLRYVFSILVVLVISGFVGLFTNILLKLRENNAILLRLSNTDQLTGGLNRMSYGNAISELASNGVNNDFVYVSIDLNGLKQTNDTLGHLAGDELIIGASNCLCEVFDEYGKVYRIGGDEFAALIHVNVDSLDRIVEKLHILAKDWKSNNGSELSLSVGYASHKEFPESTTESLIKIADERMYDAKREYYLSKGID